VSAGSGSDGVFITIEGGEGTGKSTQIAMLAGALRTAGKDVVTTREPGGSEGAEQIRRLLVEGEVGRWDALTEALLHFAARRDHVEKVIRPALAADKWVISDRFADSTMAYQGYGHDLGKEAILRLYEVVLGDFRPDLTIILDMPVSDGLARTAERSGNEDRYERMDISFHEKLRRGFLDIAAAEPDRCAVIDAAANVETVGQSVLQVVRDRLGS